MKRAWIAAEERRTVVEATMRRVGTGFANTCNGFKRYGVIASLVAVALSGDFLSPKEARAQEIQLTGPLKGAPAVRNLKLYREGRIELAPSVGFTLLDEYRRTIFLGARVQYNVKDWLGVGVWGGLGGISIATDLTDQINSRFNGSVGKQDDKTLTNVNGNTADGFQKQTAQIKWIAAPQVQLVPFRGKLALFEALFPSADAYVHAGVAVVGISERGNCSKGDAKTAGSCANSASFALQSRTAIAPTFGLGLTLYGNDWLSFGVEYRAFPFAWNRAGFDTRGAGKDGNFPDDKISEDDRTWKFNQMVGLSVGLFPQKRETSE
jgi:hypothetical protein